MTWILIIMMWGSGKAVDHIIFQDNEACNAALIATTSRFGDNQNFKAVCVPDRTEKRDQ